MKTVESKAYNEIYRNENHNFDSGDDFHGSENIREGMEIAKKKQRKED